MPSGPLQFRAACGQFVFVFGHFMFQRARRKAAMRQRTLKLATWQGGVTLGLLLSILFYGPLLLERHGDIEKNPGPENQDPISSRPLRQTRMTSASASASASASSRTCSADRNPSKDDTAQVRQNVHEHDEVGGSEPSLRDVMRMLSSMNDKFDGMKDDLKEIRDSQFDLQQKVHDLEGKVSDLQNENDELKSVNSDLQARMDRMELKTDDLECRSKRNNLIVYGIPRSSEKETSQDCEEMMKDFCTDRLELSNDVSFDRVHRINGKPDSPIILRCSFYKDKISMLKQKQKLKGTNIFLGEDFSQRVREIRKQLSPHLKSAKREGKKVTMVYDHLIINGKKFGLDGSGGIRAME